MTVRKRTPALVAKIRRLRNQGRPWAMIASELRIPESTVRSWGDPEYEERMRIKARIRYARKRDQASTATAG